MISDFQPTNKSDKGGISDPNSRDRDEGSAYQKLAEEIKVIKANMELLKDKSKNKSSTDVFGNLEDDPPKKLIERL